MKKIIIAILYCHSLLAIAANNGDPDESGIGGTGKTAPSVPDESILHTPDIPERLEIPTPVTPPEIVQPLSIDSIAPTTANDLPATGGISTPATTGTGK